jgi:hypothetical protein
MTGHYSVWIYEMGSKMPTLVADNLTRKQRAKQIYISKNFLKTSGKSGTVITYVGDNFHSSF